MGITFIHSMKNAFAIERSRMQIRRVTASARFLRARSSLYDIFPPNISPEKTKITSPIIFHFTGDVTHFYFQFPFSDNLYFPTDESGFSTRNSIRILSQDSIRILSQNSIRLLSPELYQDPLPELYQVENQLTYTMNARRHMSCIARMMGTPRTNLACLVL